MKKKKILIFGPLSSGHIQKWILPFKDEYQFNIVSLHKIKPSSCLDNINVDYIPRLTGTRLDFIYSWFFLCFYILKHKPQLLHAHYLSSYGLILAFVPFNLPKFLSVWGSDVNGKPQSNVILRFLLKKALRKFNWINSPANHLKKKLEQIAEQKLTNIDIFQYGVDVKKFTYAPVDVKDGRINILSIRNWDDIYKIDSIVKGTRAFCLANHDINIDLNIIGKGCSNDEALLIKLISENKAENLKINLIGYVKQMELINLLKEANFVISVPVMDGTPLSLLESMCVGVMPIVSDIDANREWFDREHAIYVSDYSEEAFIEAYEKSVSLVKSHRMNDIIDFNRKLVEDNGCYLTNTNKLRSKYQQFLDGF